MNDGLKDILSHSNKDIDNQQLMDYLSNHLSKTDQHSIEKTMADDEFMNDAVEGLQKFEDKQDLLVTVDLLNHDLKKRLAKNKNRKDRRKWKDQPWTYLAVIIILILLAAAYIVVKIHMNKVP